MSAHHLKQLQSRLAKHQAELDELLVAQKEAQRQVAQKRQQVSAVEKEIASIKRGAESLIISEHAMLRFIERAQLLDMSHIRSLMLPDNAEETIKSLGNGAYPIDPWGLMLRVKDNVVVTVEPKPSYEPKRGPKPLKEIEE